MNYRFGVAVDLETEKLIQSAKAAEEEINRLEKAIIELRKQKLNTDDTKELAIKIKQIKENTIALAEQRLKLRTLNKEISENVFIQKQAAKAQADFTRQVTTSKAGIEAINNVLGQFKTQVENGGDELAALKSQLVALQRLKYSGVLNAADQRVLRKEIFETNVRIREQAQALRVQQAEARKAALESKNLSTSQQQFRSQVGASNAVALEFNRIIQDAPFGIIGVGNNIQQLTANFAQLKATSGSTSAALKASLLSIVSPANLVLLGVSAITSALTLYSLNANKGVESTDKLKESYDDISDSAQNAASKIAAIKFADDKIFEEIDKILEIDSSFNFISASAEQFNEIINRAFSRLDKTQLEAFKSGLDELANDQLRKVGNELGLTREETISFIDSIKNNDQAFENLNPKIRDAVSAYGRLSNQVQLTEKQLSFYESKINKTKESQDNFNSSIEEAIKNAYDYETALLKALKVQREINPQTAFQRATQRLTGAEGDEAFAIVDVGDAAVGFEPEKIEQIKTFADFYKQAQSQISESNQILIDSFSSLGTQLAASLDISNRALRGFVTNLLNNTPKIIQAIVTTARANKAASEEGIVSAKKGALANGIFMVTETGKSLGPIGLALLPVLLGGVVALISGAFRSAGISGGGAASSAVRSNSVGSSITGFGQAANPFGDLTLRTSIRGTDIELLLERVDVKSNA